MTGEELYKKYAGYRGQYDGHKGIICGYNNSSLIIYLDDQTRGWIYNDDDVRTHIVTHNKPRSRYYFIMTSDIDLHSAPEIKTDNTNILDVAEKYINDHFKDINDHTKEIYINIFIEGYKYKKQ